MIPVINKSLVGLESPRSSPATIRHHRSSVPYNRLRKLLAERKITLELTDAARRKLGDEGYDPIYGARPLKRVIQQRIQNPLALKLLQGEFRDGDTILVDVDANGDFTFTKTVQAEVVAA